VSHFWSSIITKLGHNCNHAAKAISAIVNDANHQTLAGAVNGGT